MKHKKRYIWLLYSRLFLSKITINIEEQGLYGKVKYNFPFTIFPKDIKVFIPREHEKDKDYMKIFIPFEKKSDYSNFSTAYIRNRKRKTYNELKDIIGEKRFSFSTLEKWVFYDFLDFLFDHTCLMRNNGNQIERFQDSKGFTFWNILNEFRGDFWFLKFFLRNLPELNSFVSSIPVKRFISEMLLKVKKINLGMFEKNTQLWLVLNTPNYTIFIRYCTYFEIKQIFQDKSNEPEWFNKVKNILSRKGYEFMKRFTKDGNSLSLENDNGPRDICFLFKKNWFIMKTQQIKRNF